MVRQYETTFIVDAHLPNEQIDATVDKIIQFIEKNGGKILAQERWGKRRLAYEIRKQQYGFYVHVRYEAEGKLCQEMGRVFKLDDAVLRHLTVLLSKQALREEVRKKAEAKAKEAESAPKPEREPVAGENPVATVTQS